MKRHGGIPTIQYPGKGKLQRQLKDQWMSGRKGERGMNRRSTEDI